MASATPTDHAHSVTSTRVWPLLQIRPEFAPSVREKKSSNSLAGICMKQTPGGLGTLYLLFCRSHGTTASMPPLHGGSTTFLATPKKHHLKWEIPQEVASKQRPQPIFAKKSERPAKNEWFSTKLREIYSIRSVRTINGNIRTFTNNIRRKFSKFCVRRSNLCGSKAKMRETHEKCVRVDRHGQSWMTPNCIIRN